MRRVTVNDSVVVSPEAKTQLRETAVFVSLPFCYVAGCTLLFSLVPHQH